MLKKFWRPETGIFLAIWLTLLIGGRTRFFLDPGTFWHTVVGERLLTTHQRIDTDPFSFTFGGQPWVAYEWLGECGMALIHRLDGLDSLLVATVTILACLYTWIAHRLMRVGLHWSLAAVLVALTIGASSLHFHVRPHIVTIVFLGITMALLCDYEAGRSGWQRLFWLVPLFVVWTNIHGGMLGGLCTLILAVAGWWAARVLGLDSPLSRPQQIMPLLLLIVACTLAAFINPYGWRLPWTWIELMQSSILPMIIQEHAPLDLREPSGLVVLLFGLCYLAALVSTGRRWLRVTWLLPLVWFYLACMRVRHAPLFGITAAVVLADLLPRTRWAARLAQSGSDLFQFPKDDPEAKKQKWDWRPALLPLAVVLATVVLQVRQVPVPVLGHGWARLDSDLWPVELLPELRQHQHDGSGQARIFNEYINGGFLIYHAPDYRVFVDDRCEVYGDRWLLRFVGAEQGQNTAECIKEWEQEYGSFDLALARTGAPFDRYFQEAEAWTPVKRTDTATLYRRKSGANGKQTPVSQAIFP